MTSENKISALNDGFTPENSFDRYSRALSQCGPTAHRTAAQAGCSTNGASPSTSTKSRSIGLLIAHVQANCRAVTSTGLPAPESYRILYWNGSDFVPVSQPQGLGVALDTFNATTFEPVKTSKLRLEVVPQPDRPAGILEWRVFNYGPVPSLPPVVDAGVDRSVVSDGQTYLSGKVTWLEDSSRNKARWVKIGRPRRSRLCRC